MVHNIWIMQHCSFSNPEEAGDLLWWWSVVKTHLAQTCRWLSQTSSSCTVRCDPHPEPGQTHREEHIKKSTFNFVQIYGVKKMPHDSLHEVFTLLPKVNSVGCSATVCTEYRNTSLYGAFSCEVDGHIWIAHICVEILRFCKQPCFAVTQCTTFIKCVLLDSYLLIPDCASALNCNEELSGFGLVHNLNPRLCVVATVCAFLTRRCGS